MRIAYRVFAAFTAFVMLAALCACELVNTKEDSEIVGIWVAEVDITEAFGEAVRESIVEFGLSSEYVSEYAAQDAVIILPVTARFNSSGRMTVEYDTGTFEDTLSEWSEQAFDALVDYLTEESYRLYEEEGYTRNDVDESFELYNGTTLYNYYRDMIKDDVEDAVEESRKSLKRALSKAEDAMDGFYKVEGKKVFYSEDKDDFDKDCYLTYKLKDGKLYLNPVGSNSGNIADLWESFGAELPMEFLPEE